MPGFFTSCLWKLEVRYEISTLKMIWHSSGFVQRSMKLWLPQTKTIYWSLYKTHQTDQSNGVVIRRLYNFSFKEMCIFLKLKSSHKSNYYYFLYIVCIVTGAPFLVVTFLSKSLMWNYTFNGVCLLVFTAGPASRRLWSSETLLWQLEFVFK